MSSNEDLIERLRKAADGDDWMDTPWWWDVPERGGPADLLREAAAALSAGCQHVPLTTVDGEASWCEHYEFTRWGDPKCFMGDDDCPGPHLRLYVEAEQTKQEGDSS